jgi:subtilase family serine protease
MMAPSALAQAQVQYAIGKPACNPTARTHPTFCMAVRKELVNPSTPGAKAFVRGDGTNAAGTTGPAGGLTPSDLATAYGFTSTAATTQTVGIVDAFNDPDINADLQTFDKQYALAACTEANGCLKVVGQTGTSTLPPNATNDWPNEESLDVETVHAVCQKCKILVVEATTDNVSASNPAADMAIAENEAVKLGAKLVSNSFGYPETLFNTTDAAAFNHSGDVIAASTGDDGWRDFDYLGEFGSPYDMANAPSALNTVVGVGGTSLYLGQTAARQNETVWNDNGTKDYFEQNFGQGLGATGGGCSAKYAAQTWQTHVANWAQTVCGTKRSPADVSADADYLTGFDVYNSDSCSSACSTGWNTFGGTSLASPIITSMWALAGGSGGVAYPAANLYANLGKTSLYDVTSGGNGFCGGEGAAACGDPNTLGDGWVDCDFPATGTTASAGDRECDALAGYDGPTGVGTPNGLTAFKKPAAAVSTPPTPSPDGPVTNPLNTQ